MRNFRIASAFALLAAAAGVQGQETKDGPSPQRQLLDALRWRTVGPATMGGRIVDLAVVPSDPNVYYVGTASGGVFKTVNRGVTFKPVFDGAGALSIGDVCVAPSNPDLVWVGTGEHNARNSVSWGDGVYKSGDAGKTWKRMGLRRSFQIGRIAVHPTHPDVVLVAALGRLWGPNPERGLFRTADGGKSWKKVLHVDDNTGGIDVAFKPDDPEVLLAALYERRRDAFDGGNPARRWGPGSGLYRSTDGGRSWKKVAGGLPTVKLGRIGFGWALSSPDTVYAVIETEKIGTAPKGTKRPAFMGISGGEAREDGVRLSRVIEKGPSDKAGIKTGDVVLSIAGARVKSYADLIAQIRKRAAGDKAKVKVRRGDKEEEIELTFGARQGNPFSASLGGQIENVQSKQGKEGYQTGGIFKSTDSGRSWARVNSLNPRPFYYSQIHVDPGNDQIIFVLGVSLYRSEDGGKTFRKTGRGVHPDHHAMWIDPRDGRHVLLGCDGGLYATHDRGRAWEFVNNLPIGQFYHVTVDPRSPYRIYGGLQDNGSWGGPSAVAGRSGPAAQDWYPINGGDGFVCLVDPEDPMTVYCEMQYGRPVRVDLRTGRRTSIRPKPEKGKPFRFAWNTPFLLSAHNPRIFYIAGNYVFRSLDRGGDLRRISEVTGRTDGGRATALAESPRDPGLLYVGTDDGVLRVTRNGGHDWEDVTEALKLPGRARVSSIETSRFETGRAYVALDGHFYDDDAPHLLVTEDAGKTWRSIAANLPDATTTRALREDLENPNVLYLGTETGAWVTLDRGKSWLPLGRGLPPVAVHEFAQSRRAGELVAGTHGRGVWILDVSPLRRLEPKALEADAHLFRPGPAVLRAGEIRPRLYGQKRFVGENRPPGAVLYYRLGGNTEGVSLRVDGPDGKPVRRLKASSKGGVHRVFWDLRRNRGRGERYGRAVAPGSYTAVLEAGEKTFTQPLVVEADPERPEAPSVLEVEELEAERRTVED